MNNKSGFISTSIIYSFFVVFILIMIALLFSYTNKRTLIDKINMEAKDDFPIIDEYVACEEGDGLTDCLFRSQYIEEASITNGMGLSDKISPINFRIKSSTPSENPVSIIKNLIKEKNNPIRISSRAIPRDSEGIDVKKFISASTVAEGEMGMFATNDNYSDFSYYYRGSEDDNYISYAGFCWQIVRINGDGSIRIVYKGENCSASQDYIDVVGTDKKHYNLSDGGEFSCGIVEYSVDQYKKIKNSICNKDKSSKACSFFTERYNLRRNNSVTCVDEKKGAYKIKNIGYMNGSKGDNDDNVKNTSVSTLLEYLYYWYGENIDEKGQQNYISELTAFCGNKSVKPLKEFSPNYCYSYANGWTKHRVLLTEGYLRYGTGCDGDQNYDFRVESSNSYFPQNDDISLICGYQNMKSESFYCVYINDRDKCANTTLDTKETESDPGNLVYPIGLLSVDEIILSGGSEDNTFNNSFLTSSNRYWTMNYARGNWNADVFSNNIAEYYVYSNRLSTVNDVIKITDGGGAYIRPVLNLKSTIKYCSGDGTEGNPYRITTEDGTC